jgi:hypothetical protein
MITAIVDRPTPQGQTIGLPGLRWACVRSTPARWAATKAACLPRRDARQTLGGVCRGTLIGLLTNGVEAKIEDMRKGRSLVVENNHTVILGWSEQIFTVISELVVANANQKQPCIVVLADKDKVAMEDEIRDKVGPTKNTRVVCRSGNPIDPTDLEIVNLAGARSIVVLAPEGDDPTRR